MPKFVIERDMPGASCAASCRDLAEIMRVLNTWAEDPVAASYVTDDKIYC